MKITKLGHCCLLIEDRGKRILTDPGSFTIDEHSKLQYIDFILYTHEHGDHFHLESLMNILKNNPEALVIANNSVSKLLVGEGIAHKEMKDGDSLDENGVHFDAIGSLHQGFHPEVSPMDNTGFFVNNRFWYPGDAFTDPKREVEILALPVAGPWMNVGQGIDYALTIKPKIVIPVHDGIRYGATHTFPAQILPQHGIEFVVMLEGDIKEF